MQYALRAMRRKAGLSQVDVAAALKVGQSTVAMWENGENKPRADMLPAIAKLYGCTIDELYENEKPTA